MRPAEPDTSMTLTINIPLPNEGNKDFHVTVTGTTGDYKVTIEGRGAVNVQVLFIFYLIDQWTRLDGNQIQQLSILLSIIVKESYNLLKL